MAGWEQRSGMKGEKVTECLAEAGAHSGSLEPCVWRAWLSATQSPPPPAPKLLFNIFLLSWLLNSLSQFVSNAQSIWLWQVEKLGRLPWARPVSPSWPTFNILILTGDGGLSNILNTYLYICKIKSLYSFPLSQRYLLRSCPSNRTDFMHPPTPFAVFFGGHSKREQRSIQLRCFLIAHCLKRPKP